MHVILKRDLYIDGSLYRCMPKPTTMPSEYRNRLPADAEILIAPVEAPHQGPQTLRDFDMVRTAADAVEKKSQGK